MDLRAAWRQWRGIILSTTAVMVGLRIGDLLNVLNAAVLSRWLAPQEFGQASALLSALAIPATAVGVVVCREAVWLTETAEHDALLRYVWRWFWWLVAIGAAAGGVVLVFGETFQEVFRIKQAAVTYAFIATLLVTIIAPLWGGVLQGQHRFWPLSMIPIVQSCVRILATMGLLYAGLRLLGAVVAPTLSALAAIGWCMYWVHQPLKRAAAIVTPAANRPQRPPPLTALLNDLLPITAMTLLMSSDVIVANFLFAEQSGGFAAVSMIGKLTFYVPQGIAVVLLPHVMRNDARGESSLHYLRASVGASALMSAAIIAVLYVWNNQIMHLLRPDNAFTAYAGFLPRYTLAMGFYSIIPLTTNYAMARGVKRVGWYLLAVAPAQILVFYLFRHSMQQLVDAVTIVAGVAAVGSYVLLITLPRTRRVAAVRP